MLWSCFLRSSRSNRNRTVLWLLNCFHQAETSQGTKEKRENTPNSSFPTYFEWASDFSGEGALVFQAFSSFTQSTGGIAHALTSHGVVANSHFLYSAQENICFCLAKQFFSNLLFTSTFFKRSHKQRYNPFYFNFFSHSCPIILQRRGSMG